jgi:hypothetical protein
MNKECLLNDPRLGIITENDHRVGLCLCYRCSCGKHFCANRGVFAKRWVKHMSSYSAYTGSQKEIIKNPVIQRKSNFPTGHKLSGKSVYQQDYVKQPTVSSETIMLAKKVPGYKFGTGKSSYRDEYFNKTPEPCMNFIPPVKSVFPNSLQIEKMSTYRDSFGKINREGEKRYKSVPKMKIFSDFQYKAETTHMREYKGYDGEILKQQTRPVKQVYFNTQVKLVTTSQRDFQGENSPIKEIPRRFNRRNK